MCELLPHSLIHQSWSVFSLLQSFASAVLFDFVHVIQHLAIELSQMMALRVDLMNWIHANYAKPPQSSSCADVDRGADEGDNNEKDIFFLEALDNFEIKLNDRDIGVIVIII